MSIDALLYRPIAQKSQFEGFIPAYQGQEISFDKESDNSTTYDTLKYMDQWATKYAYQMKKVAPQLKGRDLKETVAKIYLFLYSHFQYKLDGSLQNLYSPSAAWHFRHKGFDCKTYSILASTILRNLNIPHTFRMVQQAGIMPGQWSHVYVIVPDNNTHHVIDATTHTNKEVSFTQKHDYTMIHRGLASPYIHTYGALGCACSGTPIKRGLGLGAPDNLATTVDNFHYFLDELEKQGVPKAYTDKMLNMVKWNIQNGVDPNMGEILEKTFAEDIQPQAASLGMPFTVDHYGNTGYSSYSLSGLGASAGGALLDGAKNLVGDIKVFGISVKSIAGIAKPLVGLISKVVPIDKTFGAVFANGFDLSCWNASYSEQKAKKFIEKRTPELVTESGIETAVNTETLDRFLNLIDVELFWAKNGQQAKYAKCTKKGYALQERAFTSLMADTIEGMKQNGYQLIPNGKKPTTIPNQQSSYDSYIVVPPTQNQPDFQAEQQVVYQAQPTAQVQAQPAPQMVYDATGTPVGYAPAPAPAAAKPASTTTPLLIGAGLLALKLLI